MITSEVIHSKNIEALKKIESDSIDSCVTDAPYGLGDEPDANIVLNDWLMYGFHEIKGSGFMGKEWDAFVPQPNFWKEVYRVLKPGAHVICFFGTRTYDWGVMAMRLAGFEIRDQMQWIYGSGFPKGINISKEIEKRTHEDSDEAKKYDGWKTALKPAFEPIVLARKPISEKTITDNVLRWGVGAFNINACRIGDEVRFNPGKGSVGESTNILNGTIDNDFDGNFSNGRYPSNVIFSHHPDCVCTGSVKINEGKLNGDYNTSASSSNIEFISPIKSGIHYGEESVEIWECHPDCPIKILNDQTGKLKSGAIKPEYKSNGQSQIGTFNIRDRSGEYNVEASSGGASRFFYTAKAQPDEREIGVKQWAKKKSVTAVLNKGIKKAEDNEDVLRYDGAKHPKRANNHPTVKPVSLIRYLVRLITPKGGKCIDPYNGSGTTGIGCKLEFCSYIGIEQDEYNCEISRARIAAWSAQYTIYDFFKI